MTNEETPREDKLRLVADNDPKQIVERQRQHASSRAVHNAAESLETMAPNLLRVIAGAGKPYSVLPNIVAAFEHYRDATNAGYRDSLPGLEGLIIDHLFKRDGYPETEEEWRRWAEDDPERDYQEERKSLLLQLRRHVLREIASTIMQSDLQIRREESEIDDILRRLERARENYLNRPKAQSNSYRQRIAEDQIANLRSDNAKRQEIADVEISKLQSRKRDQIIAGLEPHQWTALHAVHSGETDAFESSNAFTFDVLGRMNLLERKPGRGKSKRDWQLTDFGILAISRKPNPTPNPSK